MCGIAGILNFNSHEDMAPLLRNMLGIMLYRGPDSSGIYLNGPIGLGHNRLSIIDLNSGDQPIHNEDHSIWIIFNGEIFNYPELRRTLEDSGHRFYTQTDTEVIVHLYEEKGEACFADLNGQFAIALWDNNQEKLILARDRVGIRPLFYSHANNRLVFGSEIKSIFTDQSIPKQLDLQTLGDIFTCWAPLGAATPFQGIRQIPPGHYAICSQEGLALHQYWKLPFEENPIGSYTAESLSLSEYIDAFNELFHDAVGIRLRADVPVGAYLSGGIDSTFVSSIIKRHFNNRLCTFSVSFEDNRFDETGFQSKAVQSLQTEHRDIRCAEGDIGEIFPQIVWLTETPILRTAPAPLFLLSKLVRQSNFKVVLTGEGADEFFAGYNIFKEDRVRRFWAKNPESKFRPRLLERLYPYIFSQADNKAKQFLEAFFKQGMTETHSPIYSHMLRWNNTHKLHNFFSQAVHNAQVNEAPTFMERVIDGLPQHFMEWEPLSRAQYIESSIFMSNYLLSSQGDRMAMGNSIEGRYPFLDHRVIEFAAKLPVNYRLNGLNEKFLLKRAAQHLIPSEIVERSKQPYRAPISRSFFGESPLAYVDELLSEPAITRSGYFDAKRVNRLVDKCRNNKGQIFSERENMALVGILSTQLLDHHFIQNFPAFPIKSIENLTIYR